MEDYQKRVIEEAKSLEDKMKKLNVFIATLYFRDLESEDRNLLFSQRRSMQDYYTVLQKRIARFETEPLLSQDEVLDVVNRVGDFGLMGYRDADDRRKRIMLRFYAAIEKKILDKLGR